MKYAGFTKTLFTALTLLTSLPALAQENLTFRQLIEHLPNLPAQQVAQKVRTLNQDEQLQLSIYQALHSWVHLRACEADGSIVANIGGMPVSCQETYQQWAQTMQFSGNDPQVAFAYAMTQQQQVLVSMQCASGEIDAQSCSQYTNSLMQYNNMMHDTTQTILDNIGGGQCDNPGGYDYEGNYCQPR